MALAKVIVLSPISQSILAVQEVEYEDDGSVTLADIASWADPIWGDSHEVEHLPFEDGFDICLKIRRQIANMSEETRRRLTPPTPKPTTIRIKEIDMSTPVIAKLTTFRGQDIAKMSESQLLDGIKQLNSDIKSLKEYGVESKKISARIAEMEVARTVLVTALDGPEETADKA